MSAIGKHQRSTTARGYGNEHQRERKRWTQVIAQAGAVRCTCARPECRLHAGQCPVMIRPGSNWHLGHNRERTAWTGPECPPCNLSDGGRHGAEVSNRSRQTVIRAW